MCSSRGFFSEKQNFVMAEVGRYQDRFAGCRAAISDCHRNTADSLVNNKSEQPASRQSHCRSYEHEQKKSHHGAKPVQPAQAINQFDSGTV